MRDLVLFAQLKKREKHPWRRANFSKAIGFSKKIVTRSVTFSKARIFSKKKLLQTNQNEKSTQNKIFSYQ